VVEVELDVIVGVDVVFAVVADKVVKLADISIDVDYTDLT
jgi:hypothetical protein